MNETSNGPGALAHDDTDDRRIMQELLDLPLGESKEVTWDVTQEDIDTGEMGDCWKCPIALSAERAFPGLLAEVDTSEITLYEKDEDGHLGRLVAHGRTPGMAQQFITSFDEDELVETFAITMTFKRI